MLASTLFVQKGLKFGRHRQATLVMLSFIYTLISLCAFPLTAQTSEAHEGGVVGATQVNPQSYQNVNRLDLAWSYIRKRDQVSLPKYTPGLARPLSKKQICTTKWGKDVRHVTPRMKKQVCIMYDISSGCPGPAWEIDHLIPRELAGADDIRNLWPQPIAEARVKDHIETAMHKEFCGGTISLTDAQEQVKHWYNKIAPSIGKSE